jgi:hypothetical protein
MFASDAAGLSSFRPGSGTQDRRNIRFGLLDWWRRLRLTWRLGWPGLPTSTSKGLAVDLATTHHIDPEDFPTCRAAWKPLDDVQRAIVLHDASTEESRYRLSLKDALRAERMLWEAGMWMAPCLNWFCQISGQLAESVPSG